MNICTFDLCCVSQSIYFFRKQKIIAKFRNFLGRSMLPRHPPPPQQRPKPRHLETTLLNSAEQEKNKFQEILLTCLYLAIDQETSPESVELYQYQLTLFLTAPMWAVVDTAKQCPL